MYKITESVPFSKDMKYGDGLEPVAMEFYRDGQVSEYKVGLPYPNPFNPVVSFDLHLDANNHIDARIYDIKGREIATLYNDFLATNDKTLTWNANGYASGIYFVKVIIDGQIAKHEKIVLLK